MFLVCDAVIFLQLLQNSPFLPPNLIPNLIPPFLVMHFAALHFLYIFNFSFLFAFSSILLDYFVFFPSTFFTSQSKNPPNHVSLFRAKHVIKYFP